MLYTPAQNLVATTYSPLGRGAMVTELLRMTPKQARYYLSEARYNVVPCGRRSGKTAIGKRRLVKKALRWTGMHGARFIAAAPTHLQAKSIFWKDLKTLVPKWALSKMPSESELTIELKNGAVIQVCGLDKPERIEGSPVAHLLIDEFANTKPEAWAENLRPTLTDTQGTADLIGVPEGRNHYWDLWKKALANETGEWAGHTWFTAEVLPMYLGADLAEREIADALDTMDELTYKQEFEASFNNFDGRIYYTFDRALHAAERLRYDPNRPLVLCFDFNVEPGICVYAQDLEYKGKDRKVANEFTALLGEVWIPRNSNTPTVCRKIIADWGKRHKGEVHCYGDPAGGARSTKSEQGSDWDIIRDQLRPVFGERLRMRYALHAPLERVRVNAVNARFLTANGTKHMLVDPIMCPHTVEDFEAVCAKEGTSGEIDKDTNPQLTHLSDAVGYFTQVKHPMRSVNRIEISSAV